MNKIKKEIISSAVSRIEKSEADTIKQRYRFSPDFIGFAGHFPGNPILPAFVQILMALTLTEGHKGCRPLQPDQEIEVACRQRTAGELSGCDARLSVSEGLAASFRISFSVKEDIQ